MAQGDFWRAGVVVPIRNWRFTDFDQYAFIQAALAKGGNSLVATDKDAATIDLRTANYYAFDGLQIKLGPSSRADNSGGWEYVTISSVDVADPFTINLSGVLVNSYSAGDPIVIRTAPLGWDASQDTGYMASRKYERATGVKYGTDNIDMAVGYSAKISRLTPNAAYTHRLAQYTPVGTLLNENGAHRLYAYGKYSGDIGKSRIYLDTVYADNTVISSGAANLNFINTDFTEQTAVFTPGTNCSKAFIRAQVNDAVIQNTSLTFDNIVLTHASGTAGTASGLYTFTDYHTLGTLRYDKISKASDVLMLNNSRSRFDPSRGNVRYWLNAEFNDISQTFYNNLAILESWCLRGNDIALWVFIDDLPQVMIGTFSILSPQKNIWDLSSRSCTVRFEET